MRTADIEMYAPQLPLDLAAEFERNKFNPCVGQTLLSETERVRVWLIRLQPGERLPFHRHVLDYFWTALTSGLAVSHANGAGPETARYAAGETKHLTFGKGEYLVHDLVNAGEKELVFVTVEFLQSANEPLPLPSFIANRLQNNEGNDGRI